MYSENLYGNKSMIKMYLKLKRNVYDAMKYPFNLVLNKTSHLYYRILVKLNVNNVSTIMDIGCGKIPEKIIRPKIHYCIDPYLPYLQAIQKTNDRFWIMVEGDWRIATDIMKKEQINSVFLIDVIEHIDKQEGENLLKLTESLISDQIIVFTPLGYLHQSCSKDGKDGWGMDGATFQQHKSGWEPSDFGDGWKTWILPYYHIVDNLNNSIKPHGAILAIYNKKDVRK